MVKNLRWLAPIVVAVLALPGGARAEQVRFLYVPIGDACGNTRQAPHGPDGALGEKITGLGLIPRAYRETFKPTHMVTFRHPANGRNVIVPMTLSGGTPKMEYRNDRIIYNFGDHTVEAHFLPEGSVEVIYSTGFLRALRTQ